MVDSTTVDFCRNGQATQLASYLASLNQQQLKAHLLERTNDLGQSLLHVAVGDGQGANAVRLTSVLLTKAAEINDKGEEELLWTLDNEDKTALHYACEAKNLELVQELLRGHSSPSSSRVDIPHGVVGRVHGLFGTAMRSEEDHVTAASYRIAKELISHSVGNPLYFFPDFFDYFAVPIPQTHQLEDAVPIVVLGDHNSGKSTFMKSLQIDGALINFYHIFVNVQDVDNYRAGIIPTHTETKTFGRVIFYELSGHREFVHEAILECGQLADALFVVVVNLKDEYDVLKKQIRYWFNFIQYHHSKVAAAGNARPPNVLVVGSHADYFKLGRILGPHHRLLNTFLSVRPRFGFNYTTILPPAMDCRKSSALIVQLRWAMWYELQTLRTGRQAIPSQCYILYGILQELCTKEDGHAITVDRLAQKMASGVDLHYKLLTPETEWILEKLRYLHELNVIVLLEDKQNSGNSWVVTDCRLLLHNIEEAIFEQADTATNQYQSPSAILSYSEVVELFQRIPNRDVDLMVKLMLHFKYCSSHEDSSVLRKSYFFPHLLPNPSPGELREMVEFTKDDCCMFAWTSVPKKDQACRFFMPHLIHKLLLEVSKKFAPSDCKRMQHTVYWTDAARGVQVVLHIPGNDAVVLNMKAVMPTPTNTLKCLKLRNDIICSIRELLDPVEETATEEFFVPASYHKTLFPVFDPKGEAHVNLCGLEKVTNAVKNKLPAVPSVAQIPSFPLADILVFEPYYSIPQQQLNELATASADPNRCEEVIEQAPFFANIAESFRKVNLEHLELLLHLLDVPADIIASVKNNMHDSTWIFQLHAYLLANDFTYLKLQHKLDSVSFIKLHELF